MVRLLIVEDSQVQREFLSYLFHSDPDVEIIATAVNGEEAIALVREKRPDVITMDVHMPRMNGIDATRRIMQTCPTPIVVVSGSSDTDQVHTAFRAMEAGALAVVSRPKGIGHPESKATAQELIQTVKLMAEVKVVRRWSGASGKGTVPALPAKKGVAGRNGDERRLIAIGASTGGPQVLQQILSELPRDFPLPVLIVQHITAGFLNGFVEWLSQSTAMAVRVASHGEFILPGNVYVAPEARHMTVQSDGKIILTGDPPENGHRPSVSSLFRSVAAAYGRKAIGVLLTGMGRDGAEELKRIRDSGGTTIAQDKESSVVFGMPGEAVKLDGADYVLSAEQIGPFLLGLATGEGVAE